MRRDSLSRIDAACCRAFLTYLRYGHKTPEGRWGEPGETPESHRGKKGVAILMPYRPVSSSMVETYHRILVAFEIRQKRRCGGFVPSQHRQKADPSRRDL